jgi:hypothetical protein
MQKRKLLVMGRAQEKLTASIADFFLSYSQGFKGILDSDFEYENCSCITNSL